MTWERASKNGKPHVNTTASQLPQIAGAVLPGQRSGRKPELMRLGVDEESCDPGYRAAIRRAETWRSWRMTELGAILGWVSAGAGAIVCQAALAEAASRHLYAKALETDGAAGWELLERAARMGEKARQHQLAAWELAAREAQARTANAKQKGTGGRLAELASESRPAPPTGPRGGVVAGAPSTTTKSKSKKRRGPRDGIPNTALDPITTTGEEPEK